MLAGRSTDSGQGPGTVGTVGGEGGRGLLIQLPSHIQIQRPLPWEKICSIPKQHCFQSKKLTEMAATSLLSKCTSPFLTSPPSIPLTNSNNLSFLTIPSDQFLSPKKSSKIRPNAKKKNPWLDPFNDGEDPDIEYGSLFADGKQEEDPRPPDNPDNPYGFLKFPMGYAVEIASLGLKIRGDVRRCCCVISGGVYENLLFFPAIQLIKDRYPGVQIDIVASDRGKQCYELNKNVRWANVFDPDDDFPDPGEYLDFIGVIKV